VRGATLAAPSIESGLSLNPVKREFYAAMARGLGTDHMSFSSFIPKAWPIIEPATSLIPNWHIDCIAEYLQAVTLGQIRDLVINMPPREGKSNETTVLFPVWAWTQRPWLQFMFVSYSAELSMKHSLDRRRVLESAWYQEKWGDVVQLQPDQNRKNVYENTARGVMFSTSVGGSATGFGADIQVFDDLINPKDAESKATREAALQAFDLTFASRLNNKKLGVRIVVEQRTHKDDLTGHVLKQGGWTHLKLPAISEQRETIIMPVSGRKVVREVGDILNPARAGKAELDRQLIISGSRGYCAQYQQNPSHESGNMVKRHWWKFYMVPPREMATKMQIQAQSWDFAFKDLKDSSYVVGLVGGRVGADKYVFDESRDHMDFPDTCKAVESLTALWPLAHYKFYEDRANGPAIKAQLRQKVAGLIPVEPIGSKEARMAAAAPDIEAGNVWLPHPSLPGCAWVEPFIEELSNFPEEPNDRGDALSQLIIKLNNVDFVDNESEEGGSMLEGMNGPDPDSNEVDPNEI
jgi:predicted phage terminase large subunit-like protein